MRLNLSIWFSVSRLKPEFSDADLLKLPWHDREESQNAEGNRSVQVDFSHTGSTLPQLQ